LWADEHFHFGIALSRSRPPRPELSATRRIVPLAGQQRPFGYRRIHILLKREGWCVNVKRVCRLYRYAGLAVRKRSRKRIGLTERVPLFLPETPNHAWSMNFMHDGLADGRRIRCLNVVDDCTRESIVIEWLRIAENKLPNSIRKTASRDSRYCLRH
jgi:putative transposase